MKLHLAHPDWCEISAWVCSQAYDSHPYATYCFFIEEMNKRGIAYVHMVEPRAKGKEGAASPVAEFSNEHTDETLEVCIGDVPWEGLASCCVYAQVQAIELEQVLRHLAPPCKCPYTSCTLRFVHN